MLKMPADIQDSKSLLILAVVLEEIFPAAFEVLRKSEQLKWPSSPLVMFPERNKNTSYVMCLEKKVFSVMGGVCR